MEELPTTDTKLICVKCGSEMESGFILDKGHAGAQFQGQWISGEAVLGWRGVKTKARTILGITSYRCKACGYLESYANKPQEP